MRVIDLLHGWQLVFYLVLIGGSALGAVSFALSYGILVRWWETAYGKLMFYLGVVLALALGLTAARIFLPPFPAWVSFVLFTMIGIMVWWLEIQFIATWWQERKEKKAVQRTAAKKK